MILDERGLQIDLGDLGKFRIKDDGNLGFSVFREGEDNKLFWINSNGERLLANYMKQKYATMPTTKLKAEETVPNDKR